MELKIKLPEMDISLYIAEILQDHGKVNIPGVGTFYRKKIAAYFDEQSQMFFPPDQKISFEQTEEDDPDFSECISQTENISSDSADDILKEFAAKFNGELETFGSAEIPGIGILKKEGTQYTIESVSPYGLQPLPELESASPHITAQPDPVYQDNMEVTNNYISQDSGGTEQILENDNEFSQDTEETEKTSGRIWLLVAIPVLLIMAASLYFFYPQIKEFVQKRQAANPPKEQPAKSEPVPQDPEDSIAYQKLEQGMATAKSSDSTASLKSEPLTTGPIIYEIIIASFSLKSEAETFIKQLSGKGINVHLVEKLSGIYKYKVSAGTFKDRPSAEKELPSVQKNLNQQAWIDPPTSKTN